MSAEKFILPIYHTPDTYDPYGDPIFIVMSYWDNLLDYSIECDTDATWILITEYGAVVEKHRTGHGEPRWVIEFDSDEDRTMFLLRFS